MLNVK
jgi:hypothetical protein